jgi:oligopeptide transport system ATP-binding protein
MTASLERMGSAQALLSVRELKVHFRVKRKSRAWAFWQENALLRAVDDVSFDIARAETVGLVGESGCGKSTLARAIVGLASVTSGSIRWEGVETVQNARRPGPVIARLREGVQMIFQDPLASLDPRMTVARIVAEPLLTHRPHMARTEVRARVLTMLERVGLNARYLDRYPHEFSGGQCQRIGIARALAAEPRLVVCDEPVSALDVSIQAQVVNLLREFGFIPSYAIQSGRFKDTKVSVLAMWHVGSAYYSDPTSQVYRLVVKVPINVF